jgi:chaperonin cofactor prefoldin
MIDLQEKMEVLTKQYSQVVQQVNDAITMKTKLEGAIELTQQLLEEDKVAKDGAIEDKEEAKKVVKKVK